MNDVRDRVATKKAELDQLRARTPAASANFEHSIDLELTWSSNAIEGNTLTAVETTLVIEQGITVAGKPLRDHLEAIDHHEALRYVRRIAHGPVSELDVRNVHRLVLLRSMPESAGRYADQGRYVLTEAGRHAFPSPAEVPALMGAFASWLLAAGPSPGAAFDAHRRLVAIHPFNDGNGRTARLLMNLLLIRDGYPPVAIRPVDRPDYVAALQHAQAGGGTEPFDALLFRRLDETLDEYLREISVPAPPSPRR